MKYVVIVLSTLLCISIIGLGFNYYNFNNEYSKVKDITKEMDKSNEKIYEIDKYLDDNRNTYDEFVTNNKTKVEVYEKWLRYQKEVEEALE